MLDLLSVNPSVGQLKLIVTVSSAVQHHVGAEPLTQFIIYVLHTGILL